MKKKKEIEVTNEGNTTLIEEDFLDEDEANDEEPQPGESEELDDIIAEEAEANQQEAIESERGEKFRTEKPGPDTSIEVCKVQLTAEELTESSETLARKIGELAIKEAERKSAANQYKAAMETIENEVEELAARVRNKYEFRKVKCAINYDFRQKKVTWTRTDTGEIHRDRAMTVDELQTRLAIDSPRETK